MKTKSLKKMTQPNIRYYAELGKISSNILHDIINPITGLILYLDMINESDDNNLKNFLIPVKDTSGTIKNFIKYVDNYLNNPSETQIINLEKMIKNIINLFKPKTIKLKVEIIFSKNSDRNLIIGNPLKIFQILLNLISNSLDAFEHKNTDNKKIIIQVLYEKYLYLLIKDNASGISIENQFKIFKSKFSTKTTGIGIGLYHVYNIIKDDFQSEIDFESKLGIGTTFKIKFSEKRVINSS